MIKEETDAEEFRERIQVEQGDFIVFYRLSGTKSWLKWTKVTASLLVDTVVILPCRYVMLIILVI